MGNKNNKFMVRMHNKKLHIVLGDTAASSFGQISCILLYVKPLYGTVHGLC